MALGASWVGPVVVLLRGSELPYQFVVRFRGGFFYPSDVAPLIGAPVLEWCQVIVGPIRVDINFA
jgi:hypothetical protein